MKASDPLDELFATWKRESPPFTPGVVSTVRTRIARLEQKPNLGVRIETAFSRPSFAVAFVTACVLLGLFLAEVRLTRIESERMARLEQSYLRLIDPLIADGSAEEANAKP